MTGYQIIFNDGTEEIIELMIVNIAYIMNLLNLLESLDNNDYDFAKRCWN